MTKQELNAYIKYEVLSGKAISGLKKWKNLWFEKHLNPGHAAVYMLRKMQYYASQKGKLSSYRARYYHVRLVKDFGMCVSPNVKIGMGLHFPHPTGIVLGDATVIGENCSIYQNVTVGGARIGDAKKGNQPTVGNNVTLFSGSMVLGAVNVADNTVLAANSVLLKNADISGIYVGSPARKVESKN